MGSANLIVVPLTPDGAALLIEPPLRLGALARREDAAVAPVANDRTVNSPLSMFEPAGLARC
jgi:hypothetical protein